MRERRWRGAQDGHGNGSGFGERERWRRWRLGLETAHGGSDSAFIRRPRGVGPGTEAEDGAAITEPELELESDPKVGDDSVARSLTGGPHPSAPEHREGGAGRTRWKGHGQLGRDPGKREREGERKERARALGLLAWPGLGRKGGRGKSKGKKLFSIFQTHVLK